MNENISVNYKLLYVGNKVLKQGQCFVMEVIFPQQTENLKWKN